MVAVGLAFGERRVGEQRGGDRLQRERDAEFLHHVRFAGEIQVDLHRAGAGHHVQAQLPHLGHVRLHDLVAALGHPRHFIPPPLGLEAHAQEAELQFVGDRFHFLQVRADFAAGLVDVFQHAAGEFQLAGRLQRDRGAVAQQGDDLAVLFHRLPAKTGQSLQQGFDAALAFEGGRAQVIQAEAELLVLGADAPLLRRLLPGGDVVDQLAAVGDGRIRNVAGTGQRNSLDVVGRMMWGALPPIARSAL